MRFGKLLPVLVLVLLSACGGSDANGPSGGGSTNGASGTWDVVFGLETGGGAVCRFPSRILKISVVDSIATGTLDGTGNILCEIGSEPLSGPLVHGSVGGRVAGNHLEVTAGPFNLQFTGDRTGDSLAGALSWTVNLAGQIATLTGPWRAGRLPASPSATAAQSIDLSPVLLLTIEGDSFRVGTVARNAAGDSLAHQPTFTYSISDTSKATVSPSGWVHGASHFGDFLIGVRSGAAYSELPGHNLTVPHRLEVSPDSIVMNRTHSRALTVHAEDADGNQFPAVAIQYSSSNPLIATVSNSGLVVSPGASVGQVWIRIAAGPLRDSVPVTIVSIPVRFTVDVPYLVLTPGAQHSLGVTVFDSAGLITSDSAVLYNTDNAAAAAVSTAGVATAGSPGFADISITMHDSAASVRVLSRSAAIPSIVATTHVGTSPAGIAVSPSGTMYLGDDANGTLYRGNLSATSFPTQLAVGGHLTSIAINPAGTRAFVVADSTNGILVLDPSTNLVIDTLRLPGNDQALSVLVSLDGQRVVVGGVAEVGVFSASTGALLGSVPSEAPVVHLALHPTLPLVYASSLGVLEINYNTVVTVRTLGSTPEAGTAVAPDGSELYVAGEGPFRVYDLSTGLLKETVAWYLIGYDVALSASQDLLYLTHPGTETLFIVDRRSRVPVAGIQSPGPPRLVAIDASGTTAVVTNEGGWVDFIK